MTIVRLLWIGPARGFVAELAQDARFDIRWEEVAPRDQPDCDLTLIDAADAAAPEWLRARPGGRTPHVVLGASSDPAADWQSRGAALLLSREVDARDLATRLLELAHSEGREGGADPDLIARSGPMRDALARARRAAASRVNVLLLGETGTGKELVARVIHDAGPRAAQPFVPLNCAALPDSLLESELFGHTRGAFTGAERERRGAFEEAHGGTLFLDEIGETSPSFQAKLLRVLQERTVRPLGASRSRAVDVRVVAATHRDLKREVAAGRFREDLFYRLHVFPIRLPPLRERPEDVECLVEHFLARHGKAEGKPRCRISAEALRRLRARPWPGNVRELENSVLRALVSARPGALLEAADFADSIPQSAAPEALRSAEVRAEAAPGRIPRPRRGLDHPRRPRPSRRTQGRHGAQARADPGGSLQEDEAARDRVSPGPGPGGGSCKSKRFRRALWSGACSVPAARSAARGCRDGRRFSGWRRSGS